MTHFTTRIEPITLGIATEVVRIKPGIAIVSILIGLVKGPNQVFYRHVLA